MPEPLRLILPADPIRLGLFAVSMMLTLGVIVSLLMLLDISAFFTVNSMGSRIVAAVTVDFLAGGIIPVPFFPATLRTIVEYSPFGAMQNMPLLIFNGQLYGSALIRGLILQVFWLIVLFALGRLWMHRALRRVVAQGG